MCYHQTILLQASAARIVMFVAAAVVVQHRIGGSLQMVRLFRKETFVAAGYRTDRHPP